MPIQQMLLGVPSGSSEVTLTPSNNTTNYNLSTAFGNDWAADVAKIVTIAAGVTIGGTGGLITLGIYMVPEEQQELMEEMQLTYFKVPV